MKILFVENREKTLFWEAIASYVEAQGVQVGWLVQNPQFAPRAPKSAHTFVLPFPRSPSMPQPSNAEAWVRTNYPELMTDRGRTYFEAGIGHYEHYKTEIQRVIEEFEPDVVIGEATLFHELIALNLCRRADILYAQPASNRYPQGRFSLLAFDSQVPVIQSGDCWTEDDARALAHRIATNTEVPFYMMASTRLGRLGKRVSWALTRGRVWWGRVRGEKYNTPTIGCKARLERTLRQNIAGWRSLQRLPDAPDRSVLYPMQLQPEANIDVWGRPYVDQVQLVQELLRATPPDFQICVKANPKAKYELSKSLLDLARSTTRMCLLPFDITMPEALAATLGVVTVTGTVGLEAICGKGRAISLRHPLIRDDFPEFYAETPKAAVKRLIEEPSAGVGNLDLGTKLIQRLVSQSYCGLVADPLGYPKCLDPANVQAVASAIMNLSNVAAKPNSWRTAPDVE